MLDRIRDEAVKILMTVQIQAPEQVAEAQQQQSSVKNMQYHHPQADGAEDSAEGVTVSEEGDVSAGGITVKNMMKHVGRNDPCPCGSGKKYKHCHGKLS